MKIEELKPYQKKINIVVKAVKKGEVREVQSRWDQSNHKMAEVTVADETGAVYLTLWDDSLDSVEEGKTYEITNGYTTLFKDSLRLNTGRFGEIKPAEEELSETNTDNMLSKEIEPKPEEPKEESTEEPAEEKTEEPKAEEQAEETAEEEKTE